MIIQSKLKKYYLEIIDNLLENMADLFENLKEDLKYRRRFFFVDRRFYELYADQLKTSIGQDFCLKIEASESSKEYLNIAPCFKELIEAGFTRNDLLITIGGGILQDLSGFVATTLYRGIKWVFIPTTLLAQADSCIGSKTSINFKDSKNLIGTFYPPDRIFIDVSFCQTLTDSYFNSGVGEVIKFHLLSDDRKYGLLQEYLAHDNLRDPHELELIILSTLHIKISYFEEDEYDTGRRNLLNYGHCFGHALESATRFAICHGEAVLVGMGMANIISLRRGLMTSETYEEFESLLRKYYPRFNIKAISIDDTIRYMKQDKKRIGKDLTMILAKNVGDHIKVDDIKSDEIRNSFGAFIRQYPLI